LGLFAQVRAFLAFLGARVLPVLALREVLALGARVLPVLALREVLAFGKVLA